MKVKKILKEMYSACIIGDTVREKILWLKAIKKSLNIRKHKLLNRRDYANTRSTEEDLSK